MLPTLAHPASMPFSQSDTAPVGTVQAKLAQENSVTDHPYLADDTGVAASTAALQAALDGLADGDSLVIPDGNYNVDTSSPLTITGKSNITIRGSGRAVIRPTADNTSNWLMMLTDCHGVTIIGVKFDGRWTQSYNTNLRGNAIFLVGNTSEVTFDNCEFTRFNDECIQDRTQPFTSDPTVLATYTDTKRSHLTITGCRFHDLLGCLNTAGGGTQHVIISNNHIYDAWFGFKLNGETYVTSFYSTKAGKAVVVNNIFERMGAGSTLPNQGCVTIEDWCGGVIVGDNIFDTVTCTGVYLNQGVYEKNLDNVRVHDNLFLNFSLNCPILVYLAAATNATTIRNFAIVDNGFDKSSRAMIHIDLENGLSNNALRGLTIQDNDFIDWATIAGDGLVTDCIKFQLVTGQISEVAIVGNRFERHTAPAYGGAPGYGIRINTFSGFTSDRFLIDNNRFKGYDNSELFLASYTNDVDLVRNKINKGHVQLYGCDAQIHGNLCPSSQIRLNATPATGYSTANGTAATAHAGRNTFKRNNSESYWFRIAESAVLTETGYNDYDTLSQTAGVFNSDATGTRISKIVLPDQTNDFTVTQTFDGQIVANAFTCILGGDSTTQNVTKNLRIGLRAYDQVTNTNPIAVVYGAANSTASIINLGGGTSSHYAATSLGFYTATNTTTLTGALRWQVDTNGKLLPGADNTYDLGATGTRIKDLYAVTFHGDGSALTGIAALGANSFTGNQSITGQVKAITATSFYGADSETDSTNKNFRIGFPQYANATNTLPCVALYGFANSTSNIVNLGGGTGSGYAATKVAIVTAANNTTPTGTERWSWTTAGHYLPTADVTYDVGNATQRARQVFCTGVSVREGTNARMGMATLVAGTVTVNTNLVAASSRIFMTIQTAGGTVGIQYISAIVAGTSFTITSTSASDTSTVSWLIIEPS